MQSVAVPVFRHQYLDFSVAGSAELTSQAIPMQGNAAVLSVTTVNNSSGAAGTAILQGSYDGLAWLNIGSAVTISALGHKTEIATAVNYAYVRVKAEATAGQLLFDATIAMSEQ